MGMTGRDDRRRWWNRTVIGAGVTSALGDVCYETTTVILPGFLAVLGIPAAALGIIEGVADTVSSFTKLFAGYLADKLGRRKLLVLVGYGLTPLGQVFIAFAAGWPSLLAGRVVSWFGKGLRGPLRDAIVIQSIEPETRGRAFGFHRAMDTLGAVIGPLAGVTLLGWAHTSAGQEPSAPFRWVLWLGMIPGVMAVLTFLILVRDPARSPNPTLKFVSSLRNLPPRFRRYLAAVGVFGCGDFSHSLLILAATQLLAPSVGLVKAAQIAGLLYVVRNVVQAAAAFPAGALADRWGAARVLVAGYVLGAFAASLTAAAFWLEIENVLVIGSLFFVAGLYMAVQETLEATVTAGMVDPQLLGTGLGALGTINGTAKLISSATVGIVWSAASPTVAFALAAGLMAFGTLLLARLRDAPAESKPAAPWPG
jgi:MFS family permease